MFRDMVRSVMFPKSDYVDTVKRSAFEGVLFAVHTNFEFECTTVIGGILFFLRPTFEQIFSTLSKLGLVAAFVCGPIRVVETRAVFDCKWKVPRLGLAKQRENVMWNARDIIAGIKVGQGIGVGGGVW